MTFSIYLGFGIYENLADTTENFFYVLTDLLPDANYTIRVESVIPYSTQMISSTTYHFLESEEVTGPTVLIYNTSQSTQTSITTPVNQVLQISNLLSDYLSLILISGLLIMFILFVVLVVIIAVVTCCIMKRRIGQHTTTPIQHASSLLFVLSAHVNEIYHQSANKNPAYMPEKEDKIELGMDNISFSNHSNEYDV